MYAFTFDDTWFDIGTPDSYFETVEWGFDIRLAQSVDTAAGITTAE